MFPVAGRGVHAASMSARPKASHFPSRSWTRTVKRNKFRAPCALVQRVRVIKTVRSGLQDHDGKRQVFEFLLVRQVFIHREEDLEFAGVGNEAQKLSVFDACPARPWNGLDFVAGQILPQTRGQTFIKENSHSDGLRDFLQHGAGRFFQKGDGLLARDGGKIVEKNINAVTGFEMVKERAHRNPRAGEARLAAHDFRVNHHDGLLLHAGN